MALAALVAVRIVLTTAHILIPFFSIEHTTNDCPSRPSNTHHQSTKQIMYVKRYGPRHMKVHETSHI